MDRRGFRTFRRWLWESPVLSGIHGATGCSCLMLPVGSVPFGNSPNRPPRQRSKEHKWRSVREVVMALTVESPGQGVNRCLLVVKPRKEVARRQLRHPLEIRGVLVIGQHLPAST